MASTVKADIYSLYFVLDSIFRLLCTSRNLVIKILGLPWPIFGPDQSNPAEMYGNNILS